MLNFAYLTKKINFAGLQPDADLVPKYLLASAKTGDMVNFAGLQPGIKGNTIISFDFSRKWLQEGFGYFLR
jgi:hypothetical protein